MGGRLRILRGCIKRRNWRGIRFIMSNFVLGLWPICYQCGAWNWDTRRLCWRCRLDNFIKFLSEPIPEDDNATD